MVRNLFLYAILFYFLGGKEALSVGGLEGASGSTETAHEAETSVVFFHGRVSFKIPKFLTGHRFS